MSARTVGLWLWLVAGGLAAATLVWQLRHPPRLPTAAATGTTARMPELPVVTPLEPFHLPPAEQYAETVARPLFIPARRPEPPPPPDEAPPPATLTGSEQKFLLLGVMITAQTTVALLRSEEPNAKTIRAKAGDRVGEWRLETIFPNRVVLQKGTEKQELGLVRPKKPVGPRPGKRNGPGPAAAPKPAPVAAPPDALQQPVPPPLLIAPNPPQQ